MSWNTLIEGLEHSLPFMRVGEIANITLPWQHGFGEAGNAELNVGQKTDVSMEIEIHSAKNLEISCHNEGEGDLIPEGSIINVKYEGRLINGSKQFDENFTKEGMGYELDLTAGNKMAIDGWYLALRQMRLNQRCTAVIPAEFAYKKTGFKEIPANATLIFDMELTVAKIMNEDEKLDHMQKTAPKGIDVRQQVMQ